MSWWKSALHENHYLNIAKTNSYNRFHAAFNMDFTGNTATILEIRTNGKPVTRHSDRIVPLPDVLHYERHVFEYRKANR